MGAVFATLFLGHASLPRRDLPSLRHKSALDPAWVPTSGSIKHLLHQDMLYHFSSILKQEKIMTTMLRWPDWADFSKNWTRGGEVKKL